MPPDKMRVYFTIDTETSMNGAWHDQAARPLPLELSVFGKLDSHYYGIPLIMDILESHGFRGTFFTEVLCSYVLGDAEVAKVFAYIQQRGHDAQLHLHPVYWYYHRRLQGSDECPQDLMCDLTPAEQDHLIAKGVSLFRQLSGARPRAYRAGCYGASETTLGALRQNGLEIDSSYNLCYLDGTCKFQYRPLNGPRLLEGVHEFPVTNFSVRFQPGYKPLEVGAVSVEEILATIHSLRDAGCRDVVISLHSFSFLKNLNGTRWRCRPDRMVIHRFEKLCRELARLSSEIEVPVLGDRSVSGTQPRGSDHVPCLGWREPLVRKVVQGVNRLRWI